jgi:hypothetical protein
MLGAGLVVGCSKRTDEVLVEGLPYSFPKSHLNSLVMPDKGHLYVRLHPPGENFALLHDPMSDRQQREEARTVIPTISDRFSRQVPIQTAVGEVFCLDGLPHYSCGFELYDQDVRWSVVFDRGRLRQVLAMRANAVVLLQSYRRGLSAEDAD